MKLTQIYLQPKKIAEQISLNLRNNFYIFYGK